MGRCDHCGKPAIANLDGENLCIDHGRQWLRGEQEAERERKEQTDG